MIQTQSGRSPKPTSRTARTGERIKPGQERQTMSNYIYVKRWPSSSTEGAYDYYRSDMPGKYDDPETFDNWSDAYDAGDPAPYAPKGGEDWEAVTVEEADRVWPAIDGSEGDGGFAAAVRLAEEMGDETPTDEEFDEMDDPDEWPRTYAWTVLGAMSHAHANEWRYSRP